MRSRVFGNEAVVDQWRKRFAVHGVGPERLELDGRRLPVAEHLAVYGGVDVALDAFPYNGTTTTCEALWMGVPVVTLLGEAHVGRVGASLLTHLGEPGWIARTEAEYVGRVLELVSDLPRLAAVRAGLRERMAKGPLCDGVGFTREWERAVEAMVCAKRGGTGKAV
jgi:predicted O-linked N-acetylglucosamine transferase (SPINDLY family)